MVVGFKISNTLEIEFSLKQGHFMTLKPLYTVRRNLNLKIVTKISDDKTITTSVPGMAEHARLMGAEQDYRRLYEESYNSKSGHKSINAANIVTGSLTFLYSTEDIEETDPGDQLEMFTFDIVDRNYPRNRSVTTANTFDPDFTYDEEVYNKDGTLSRKKSIKRNSQFIEHIQSRINLVLGMYRITDNAIINAYEFKLDPQFPENFHHSEQAKNEAMIDDNNLRNMVRNFLELDPAFFAVIVKDFHSSNPMCVNCNIAECGCQQPKQGGYLYRFLEKLEEEVTGNDKIDGTDQHIKFPINGVTMHTRVSASIKSDKRFHSRLYHTPAATAHPLLISSNNTGVVLQKSTINSKIATDSLAYRVTNYEGNYFLSANIRTTNLDKKIIRM